MLNHYRGKKSKYEYTESNKTYKDGIYFTTDSHEILVNGLCYSGCTYEDIRIQDGPLADHIISSTKSWPSDWIDKNNNKIIPKDKSLLDILTTLLLREIWPESFLQIKPSITVTGNPTQTAMQAATKESTMCEVGDIITVTGVSALAVNVSPQKKSRVGEFKVADVITGYSLAFGDKAQRVTKSVYEADTMENPSEDKEAIAGTWGLYKLSMQVTGMTELDGDTISDKEVSSTTLDDVTIAGFAGKAIAGTNFVLFTQTSNFAYKANYSQLNSVYYYSSLFNLDETRKTAAIPLGTAKATCQNGTTNATLTGVYAIYSSGRLHSYKTFGSDTERSTYEKNNFDHNADLSFENWAVSAKETATHILDETTGSYRRVNEGETAVYVLDDKVTNGFRLPREKYELTRLGLTTYVDNNQAFYAYVGFGGGDNDCRYKVIFVPKGWRITEVKLPNPSDKLYNAHCEFTQINTNNISEFSKYYNDNNLSDHTLAKLKTSDFDTYGYFDYVNSSGHTSEYSAWVLGSFNKQESVRIKFEH